MSTIIFFFSAQGSAIMQRQAIAYGRLENPISSCKKNYCILLIENIFNYCGGKRKLTWNIFEETQPCSTDFKLFKFVNLFKLNFAIDTSKQAMKIMTNIILWFLIFLHKTISSLSLQEFEWQIIKYSQMIPVLYSGD